jgi:hypothetical protein
MEHTLPVCSPAYRYSELNPCSKFGLLSVYCTRLVKALDFHLRYCIKWVCLQLAHFHILHLGLADKLGKVRASTSCALHANSIRAQRALAGKSL